MFLHQFSEAREKAQCYSCDYFKSHALGKLGTAGVHTILTLRKLGQNRCQFLLK